MPNSELAPGFLQVSNWPISIHSMHRQTARVRGHSQLIHTVTVGASDPVPIATIQMSVRQARVVAFTHDSPVVALKSASWRNISSSAIRQSGASVGLRVGFLVDSRVGVWEGHTGILSYCTTTFGNTRQRYFSRIIHKDL